MKKRRLLAMLLTGAMCASLAACGNSDAPATSGSGSSGTADGKTSVDVILKTTASEYWSYVKAGAEAYGKDNADVKVRSRVLLLRLRMTSSRI